MRSSDPIDQLLSNGDVRSMYGVSCDESTLGHGVVRSTLYSIQCTEYIQSTVV